MATELTMPQMGYDMQEGTVVRWLKAEGSNIQLGEPVAEIETDKAVVEFESYAAGVLQAILVEEGSTVPVGQPIAVVGDEVEVPLPVPEPETSVPVAESAPDSETADEEESESHTAIPLGAAPTSAPPVDGVAEGPLDAPAQTPSRRVFATPIARQMAYEAGIDLDQVQGTGPGGRIVKEDIATLISSLAATPVEAETEAETEAMTEEQPEVEVVEAETETAAEEVVEAPVATEAETEAMTEEQPEVEVVEAETETAAEEVVEAPVATEAETEAMTEEQPVGVEVVEAEAEIEAEVEAPVATEAETEAMTEEQPVGVEVVEAEAETAAEEVVEAPAEMEAEPQPEPEPDEAVEAKPDDNLIPLSRMRRQIARVTIRSKDEKPHFYVNTDVDMTDAMALRTRINDALAEQGVRATVNDLIIAASIIALRKFPKFNAYYEDGNVRMNDSINVGIAMALEEGLIMPAVVGAGAMSLKEIAQATKDLAARANQGILRPEEYSGGTFAISNMGMMNVTSFVAIIQPPQTAVLAVGAVQKRPVVAHDDSIVVRQMMTATLSADHRIVDGAEGALFINEIKRLLENPLSVIL